MIRGVSVLNSGCVILSVILRVRRYSFYALCNCRDGDALNYSKPVADPGFW